MAQQAKALVTNSDDLSSVPGTYVVGVRTTLKVVL